MIPTALGPVAAHLWQSTIFAAVAALLALALRRNQARVRYGLWLAASYKFLVPFAWLVSVGGLFAWRAAPAMVPSPVFTAVTETISAPAFLTPLPAAKVVPDHTAVILWVIGVVWACGLVVIAAGWVREWLRIRAIARAGSPVLLKAPASNSSRCHSEERSDEESLLLLGPACREIPRFARNDNQENQQQVPHFVRNDTLQDQQQIPRRYAPRNDRDDDAKDQGIRVVTTEVRLDPGVFGIWRPVLLLPEGIATRLTAAQLQGIVAHEVAHVRRRDNLTAAIHMLVEAVFWFYPLVWWLGARLVDERERACDEEVLQAGSEAQSYAESVLKVCEFYLESPLRCVSGITGSDLKQRMRRIMRGQTGAKLSAWRKALLIGAAVAVLAVPLVAGALSSTRVGPQPQHPSSTLQWEIDAGGEKKFDVASVKPDSANVSPTTTKSNIPLGPQDQFTPTGGYFSATNFSLMQYLLFAYKLTPDQFAAVRSQLPKWANTNRYDIEARAPGNPTKDQFRLMTQALLADRFKLRLHYETKQLPVMALVVDKPGKLGPQLQQHPPAEPCSTAIPTPGAPLATVADGFPETCGAIVNLPPKNPGRVRMGGRNVPIAMMAAQFTLMQSDPQLSNLSRPMVDKTGIIGGVDFVMEFSPEISGPLPPGTNFNPDPNGPTFQQALKEQLGLRLEPRTAPVDTIVIDHVEEPTENSAAGAEAQPNAEAASAQSSGGASVPSGSGVSNGAQRDGAPQTTAGAANVLPTQAQTASVAADSAERPKFEAASVKPSAPGNESNGYKMPPGRFTATNLTLRTLISVAYQLPGIIPQTEGGPLVGGPDWTNSLRYDIEATASGNPSREQVFLMLQSLLAERFKLAAHYETRQLPVYALTMVKPGKTGPQLFAHTDNSHCFDASPGSAQSQQSPGNPKHLPQCGGSFVMQPGHLPAEMTIETLAKRLSWFPPIDRAVLDRTGLGGTFDLTLDYNNLPPEFAAQARAAAPGGIVPDLSDLPPIYTALQDQLGLKLESQTGPVNVLVIDHVEQPTPN